MHESDVFLVARRLRSPERERYLADACGDNVQLRSDIEELLDADCVIGHSTSESRVHAQETQTITAHSLFAGRYRLGEKLGEGGMGMVFLAEQLEPVQRRVAVKIIRSRFASSSTVARFELEAQALALMDHPHIAKVFDAGVDQPDGTPYLVMEWIQGVPITHYCEEANLSLRQRVELFISVCQAIQHAHQKGIIHRDLKPSNILVGVFDGKPVPKIIDFGVAKATAPELTPHSAATEIGSLIGTLEYMSPEQAQLSNRDIDTRTDIYALGVILYELLTGLVPFSRKDIDGLAEMLRVIQEEEPRRPSVRVLSAGLTHAPSTASGRWLQGDLDCIVMKALEKDRQHRYETADALAVDLQRYLDDEPIDARAPTSRYRLYKFLRRYRSAVLAASLLVLVLLGGSIGTTWGLLEANEQRYLAEQNATTAKQNASTAEQNAATALKAVEEERLAKEAAQAAEKLAKKRLADFREERQVHGDLRTFFLVDVLGQAAPGKQRERGHAPNPNLTIKEVLHRAIIAVDERYAPQSKRPYKAKSEIEVRLALGETLFALGEYHPALMQYEKALALREKYFPPESILIRNAENLVIQACLKTGNHDRALALLEKHGGPEALGKTDAYSLTDLTNLAIVYGRKGQAAQALMLYRRVFDSQVKTGGLLDASTLAAMQNLATGYLMVDRIDQALPLFEQAFANRKKKNGPDHPSTLITQSTLGWCYYRLGRNEDAFRTLEAALHLQCQGLGADHPNSLLTRTRLAAVYLTTGFDLLAIELYESLVSVYRKKNGDTHPSTIQALQDLAAAYGYLHQDDQMMEVQLRIPPRAKK